MLSGVLGWSDNLSVVVTGVVVGMIVDTYDVGFARKGRSRKQIINKKIKK